MSLSTRGQVSFDSSILKEGLKAKRLERMVEAQGTGDLCEQAHSHWLSAF